MTKTFAIDITRKDFENMVNNFDNEDILIASILLIKRACSLNEEKCEGCLFNNGICRAICKKTKM